MDISDFIQIGILLILIVTLIVTTIIQRNLVSAQQNLLSAQLIWFQFDMYRWTIEPVTQDEIEDFKTFPYDYINPIYYNNYYDKEEAIRKFLYCAGIYEYLTHMYAQKRIKVKDYVGDNYHWIDLWLKDLIEKKEFMDVHQEYKNYYPYFGSYVDNFIKNCLKAEDENLANLVIDGVEKK